MQYSYSNYVYSEIQLCWKYYTPPKFQLAPTLFILKESGCNWYKKTLVTNMYKLFLS